MIPMGTGMLQLEDLKNIYKKFNAKPGYSQWAGKNSDGEMCYCPMTLLFLIDNPVPKIFTTVLDWVTKNYGNYGRGFLAGWDDYFLFDPNNPPYMRGYKDGKLFREELKPQRIVKK